MQFHHCCAAALLALDAACVTSPHDGQRVDDAHSEIQVVGYVNQPRAALSIEAYNPSTGRWDIVGSALSDSNAALAAGIWTNSPALYAYSTTVRIAEPSDPSSLQRWEGTQAQLRVRWANQTLLRGGEGSVACMQQRAGTPLNDALAACGFAADPIRVQQRVPIVGQLEPETVFLAPERLRSSLALALFGTRFQLSQTGNGEPLSLPDRPTPWLSYVDFSELLEKRGGRDRGFDVPVEKHDLGQGGLAAIGFASGLTFTAFEIRLLVNNLHTTLDIDTLEVGLDDDALTLGIELESDSPSIKCEANTLSFLPFLFPIPVGWRDESCPDAQLIDPRLRIRLLPAVGADGRITIRDAEVVLDAEIRAEPADFLDELVHFKQRIRDAFEAQLREQLLADDLRAGLGAALTELFERERGSPIARARRLYLDEGGALLELER